MIRRMNSLTIYALGAELDRLLSGASITAVRRFPDGITLFLLARPVPLRAYPLSPQGAGARSVGSRARPAEPRDRGNGRGQRETHRRGPFHGVRAGARREARAGSRMGQGGEPASSESTSPRPRKRSRSTGEAPKSSSPRSARRRRGEPAGPNETLTPRSDTRSSSFPPSPPAGLIEETPRAALSSSAPDHTRRWKHAKASADALARSIGGIDPVLAGVLSKSTEADPARLWPLLVEIGARLAAGAWDWHLYEFPEEGEAGRRGALPGGASGRRPRSGA